MARRGKQRSGFCDTSRTAGQMPNAKCQMPDRIPPECRQLSDATLPSCQRLSISANRLSCLATPHSASATTRLTALQNVRSSGAARIRYRPPRQPRRKRSWLQSFARHSPSMVGRCRRGRAKASPYRNRRRACAASPPRNYRTGQTRRTDHSGPRRRRLALADRANPAMAPTQRDAGFCLPTSLDLRLRWPRNGTARRPENHERGSLMLRPTPRGSAKNAAAPSTQPVSTTPSSHRNRNSNLRAKRYMHAKMTHRCSLRKNVPRAPDTIVGASR